MYGSDHKLRELDTKMIRNGRGMNLCQGVALTIRMGRTLTTVQFRLAHPQNISFLAFLATCKPYGQQRYAGRLFSTIMTSSGSVTKQSARACPRKESTTVALNIASFKCIDWNTRMPWSAIFLTSLPFAVHFNPPGGFGHTPTLSSSRLLSRFGAERLSLDVLIRHLVCSLRYVV